MPDYFPSYPFIVLDQNECRNESLVERLFQRCRREGLKILLPDMAVYEFSKGVRAYLTWRASLEHLCKAPDLVVAGRSIGEMMKEELRKGRCVAGIVDQAVTRRFQLLLDELRRGDDTRINKALSAVVRFIDKERKLRERHRANKNILVRLRNEWQRILPEKQIKLLRNQDATTVVNVLSEFDAASFVYRAARRDGCTKEEALTLTSCPSIYGHSVQILAAIAVDWLAYGGLEGTPDEKVTNDIHDLDYICFGTFCTDLVTRDKRAKRVYSAIMKALDKRWRMLWKEINDKKKGKS